MKTFKEFFYLFEKSEIYNNIKNASPVDVWKVAQDIRRYPGDYPDIEVNDILHFMYFENIKDFKNRSYHFFSNEKSFIYINHDEAFKMDKKYANEVIVPDVRKSIGYSILSDKTKHFSDLEKYNISREAEKITQQYQILLKKSENRIKYASHMLNSDNTIRNNMFYDKTYYEKIIKAHKKKINKLKKKYQFIEMTSDDILAIFDKLNIDTPTIYQFLVKKAYNLPKHRDEIPEELRGLPYFLLKNIRDGSMTLQSFARDTSRGSLSASDDIPDTQSSIRFRISGNLRVINNNIIDDAIPTKKESHLYTVEFAKSYGEKRKKLEKQIDADPESYLSAEVRFPNFPEWLFMKKGGEKIIEKYENSLRGVNAERAGVFDLSFDSWMVFRWFLHNMNSVYFYKKKIIHGAAGTTTTVVPILNITEIKTMDLVNGLKTSPEVAFENAEERKKNINKNIQFDYGRKFQDTEQVFVINNTEALRAEGIRMNHCVGNYSDACLSKSSLILALPHSTAELNPSNLNIYQHNGYGNKPPPESDVELLNQWIQINKK